MPVRLESESAVEQAAAEHDMTWIDVVRRLEDEGADERTRTAVYQARGGHSEGASRLVAATTSDATVRRAVPLGSTPARPVVDVSPLPHLLPLIDDVTTRVPHVVVLADQTGSDVSADDDTVVAAGEDRRLVLVAEHLPAHLEDSCREVRDGRVQDGGEAPVRRRVSDAVSRSVATRTLHLLEGYAQERGQRERAVDDLADVVEELREAQVETVLVATDAPGCSTLLFGAEPTQLGTSAADLSALGIDDPQEGPMTDVLIRAALRTAGDGQLVPHEMATAPQGGTGAVLRYAAGTATPSDASA